MEDHKPVVGSFSLERDGWDRLVLTDETGDRYVGVEAVRAFPISDPQHAISICDSRGREIVYIPALDVLPRGIRETLEIELSQREFVPLIRRILNNPPDTEPTEWKVETDRGVTVFQLESENDVHRNEAGQVTLVDAHGIRYLLPDTRQLDAHSRRVLDRFL
jgi:Domain of unknown function (DUF1854)